LRSNDFAGNAEAALTALPAVSLFISLLVIVNPALAVPVYLNLTRRCTARQRQGIALTAAAAVAAILVVAALFGTEILAVLRITVDALRAAGGVLVILLAIDLLWPPRPAPPTTEDPETQSPAIVPIAFPLLAGPGSIAVVISAAADYPGWAARGVIGVVIGAIALVALLGLLLAAPIYRLLGDTGLDVLSRLMAMVLLGVGVEMLVVGLGGMLPGLTR
jgi:multiple antibiotic resistance protein